MDKQTNLNKCLRIYASWRSLKWEKLESNQMNGAVLYTQSWVVSLQTNTLSTLYIYIRAFYSWTLQSAFQKLSLCLPGKAAPCGVKASSVRQLALHCSAGRGKILLLKRTSVGWIYPGCLNWCCCFSLCEQCITLQIHTGGWYVINAEISFLGGMWCVSGYLAVSCPGQHNLIKTLVWGNWGFQNPFCPLSSSNFHSCWNTLCSWCGSAESYRNTLCSWCGSADSYWNTLCSSCGSAAQWKWHFNTVHAGGGREQLIVLSSTYCGSQSQPRLYQAAQNLGCTL